ncbi:hypothetical protein J6590_031230, partial [Homalodisca vitripennis]
PVMVGDDVTVGGAVDRVGGTGCLVLSHCAACTRVRQNCARVSVCPANPCRCEIQLTTNKVEPNPSPRVK